MAHNKEVSPTVQLGNDAIDSTKLFAVCQRYHVQELSLFGSAARGEMKPGSDLDLLVTFLPGAAIDLVDYASLMLDLAELMGCKVDLVSKRGLKPSIKDSVLRDARLLYAA